MGQDVDAETQLFHLKGKKKELTMELNMCNHEHRFSNSEFRVQCWSSFMGLYSSKKVTDHNPFQPHSWGHQRGRLQQSTEPEPCFPMLCCAVNSGVGRSWCSAKLVCSKCFYGSQDVWSMRWPRHSHWGGCSWPKINCNWALDLYTIPTSLTWRSYKLISLAQDSHRRYSF